MRVACLMALVLAGTAEAVLMPTPPLNVPRGLAVRYARVSRDHFLPLAAAQAGALRGVRHATLDAQLATPPSPPPPPPPLHFASPSTDVSAPHRRSLPRAQASDLVGQGLQHAPADPTHAVAMAAIAAGVSGFGGAMWLRKLEGLYGTSTEPGVVARKTATDYVFWAPIANTAYLLGLPLLTGHGAEAALSTWQAGFVSVMLLELSIFMPYNVFAFRMIPLEARPLVQTLLSAAFTIGLCTVSSC